MGEDKAERALGSAAAESAGGALELVAGQVLQGTYAPRRRSLLALPGEILGMLAAATLPAATGGYATFHLLILEAPFGPMGGGLLWMALAASAWLMGFLAVERVVDRIGASAGEGVAMYRWQALGQSRGGLLAFLGGYLAIYLGGCALMRAAFQSTDPALVGLWLSLIVAPPAFLLAPWVAARAQVRARLGGQPPVTAVGWAGVACVAAPLMVFPRYAKEISTRRRADLDWFRRVPSDASLDLLTIGSVVVHGAVLITVSGALGLASLLALPVLLGMGALHLQHELAVLAETGAGVEARRRGEFEELLAPQPAEGAT